MRIHFDTVIQLMHKTSYGVLATQSAQLPGYPFASILPFILDEQHRPVFLVSSLAEHTKNVLEDHHASFLVASPDAHNVLTEARLTLIGDVMRFDASRELVARYLRYQPDAKRYLDLGDFAFFRLTPRCARYVGGFGEMGWIEESEWPHAAVLPLAAEAKFHLEVLPIGIRLLGVDCYGVDIERQGMRARQQFPNAPVAAKNADEVMKPFLAAL